MSRLLFSVCLAIVFLGQQQITKTEKSKTKATPFLCQSPEDIQLIENGDVKRFIVHKSMLYLVFAEKVISLRWPVLGDAEPSLTVGESFYYVTPENDSLDVIGNIHFYDWIKDKKTNSSSRRFEEFRVDEVYYDDANKKLDPHKVNRLTFDDVPGKRAEKPTVKIVTPSSETDSTAHTQFTRRTSVFTTPAFARGPTLENIAMPHKRDLVEYVQNRTPETIFEFKLNKQSFLQVIAFSIMTTLIVSQQQDANESADNYELVLEVCLAEQKNEKLEFFCLKRLKIPVGKRRIQFFGAEQLRPSNDSGDILNIISFDSDRKLVIECKNRCS